jgi:hypothetical protein
MFKKLEINAERDLENLVAKDPESIERGLKYLDHQRNANGKFIDVLAVDADGVLTVIELKVGQDDEMLLQALEYYDYVSSNRDRLANEYAKICKIVADEDPRIILVASGFSDRLKSAVRHFEPSTILVEYAYLESKTGERGLFCQKIQHDSEDSYTPPASLENVLSYINQPKVRMACEKIHAELCKVGQDIEPIPRDGYVRYKCKNRVVGDISIKRTFVRFWANLDGNNWDSIKVASINDWSSKKSKILKSFIKRYHSVGGE